MPLQEAVHEKGLCDDTTCIVIDMLPPEKPSPAVPPVKNSKKKIFKLFRKKLSEPTSIDNDFSEPDLVEEIFEDGSAVLSQRFLLCCCVLVFKNLQLKFLSLVQLGYYTLRGQKFHFYNCSGWI